MSDVGPEDVLVLADGTKVYPDRIVKPTKHKLVEVPTNREATELIVQTRRRLSELPELPSKMNAISVIISYTLYGLGDEEIAIALNITSAQISRIRSLDTYKTMYNDIVSSVLAAEADNVRDIFVKSSRSAAMKIVNSMDSDGITGMAAASQILDRAGLRPVDVVEHRHKISTGLQIEFINRDTVPPPVIDMDL